MATRRPRIVIKPNIRPTPKAATPSSKPKTTPSVTSSTEATAVSSKAQLVEEAEQIQQNNNAAPDPPIDSESSSQGKGREKEPESSLNEPSKSKEDEVGVTTDTNERISASSKEDETDGQRSSSSVVHQASLEKEKLVSEDADKSTAESIVKVQADSKSVEQESGHQERDKKRPTDKRMEQPNLGSTADTVAPSLPPSDINEKSGQDAENSSEVADSASCVSEALSMDEEKRGDGEEDAQAKKTKKRRVLKTRTDALPSREKSPDRQKMKMSDLLFWNPQQNYFPKKAKAKSLVTRSDTTGSAPSSSPREAAEGEDSNQSSSLPAPQVMIGPDGSVVLNTESLMIPCEKTEGSKVLREVVEEDDDDLYLNTNSYRTTKRAKIWTEKETEKFFLGLSMCGTDFSLLTRLMPHRSRRDLKNKFRREEKRNRPLIDKALANKQKYDPAPFAKIHEEKEKKVKPEIKRKVKSEAAQNVKKTEQKPTKRRKKAKMESEDEEDDWGPEYDDLDEDTEIIVETSGQELARFPSRGSKRGIAVKGEPVQKDAGPENPSSMARTAPSATTSSVGVQSTLSPQRPNAQTAMVQRQGNYQTLQPTVASQPSIGQTTSSADNQNSILQSLPGSSQIQIEMEGIQNPVQGVLIAPHMVPVIAPQLGIQHTTPNTQVLLVQEETPTGSMVHVYVIPESDVPPTTLPGTSASSNQAPVPMDPPQSGSQDFVQFGASPASRQSTQNTSALRPSHRPSPVSSAFSNSSMMPQAHMTANSTTGMSNPPAEIVSSNIATSAFTAVPQTSSQAQMLPMASTITSSHEAQNVSSSNLMNASTLVTQTNETVYQPHQVASSVTNPNISTLQSNTLQRPVTSLSEPTHHTAPQFEISRQHNISVTKEAVNTSNSNFTTVTSAVKQQQLNADLTQEPGPSDILLTVATSNETLVTTSESPEVIQVISSSTVSKTSNT